MSRLRNSVIILLLYFVCIFILSTYAIRVGEYTGTLQLGAWLAIIASLSIILLQIRWTISPLFAVSGWIFIYFLARLIISGLPQSLVSSGPFSLIFLEIIVITVAVILACNYINALNEVSFLLKNKLRVDVSIPIGDFEKAQEHLGREIYRSRRFKHPLSVVLMQPQKQADTEAAVQRIVEEVQLSLNQEYILAGLASATKGLLRQTDLLYAGARDNYLILVSPYTDTKAAEMLVERISQEVQAQLGFCPDFGTATFPDDAIASDELIELAKQRLEETPPGT